ncbi:hypothetical protein IWZ01DRAFT_226122 [Phyllosticta capitalensis]
MRCAMRRRVVYVCTVRLYICGGIINKAGHGAHHSRRGGTNHPSIVLVWHSSSSSRGDEWGDAESGSGSGRVGRCDAVLSLASMSLLAVRWWWSCSTSPTTTACLAGWLALCQSSSRTFGVSGLSSNVARQQRATHLEPNGDLREGLRQGQRGEGASDKGGWHTQFITYCGHAHWLVGWLAGWDLSQWVAWLVGDCFFVADCSGR